MQPKRFHLVQRIRLRPDAERTPEKGPIDGVFQFDYRGSAEFEFGALPRSLKELRATSMSAPVRLAAQGQKAWYVGRPEFQEVAQTFFELELHHPWKNPPQKPYYLKEVSNLYWSYHPEEECDIYRRVDGWWTLDEGAPWALFRTKEAAQLWHAGIVQPSSGGAGKSVLDKVAQKLGVTRSAKSGKGHF